MKNSNFLLLSFLFLFVQSSFLSLNAQEEDPPVPNFLFLFGQINVPGEIGIIHTLTALGTYWELDAVNEEFPISMDGDLEEAYANISGSTTPEPSYKGSTAWKGFIFPWSSGGPYIYTDDIAYGIYKVTGFYDYYFYLDLRDCRYRASFVPGQYFLDFFIRFNDDGDISKWKTSEFDWTEISVGEVLKVWEIKNTGTPPTTSYFEDFWENCLIVVNNGNGNPKLVWGPNPDFENITGYKIYRALHWEPFPDPIVYSLIATVADDETFDYTDSDLKLSGNGDYVWYYVKAYNSQTESSQSNVVTTRAGFYKKNNSDKLSSTGYGLNQNFPNPFNPATQIDYTIKLATLVTIKVYDVLGNEVASLVNERKQPGDYYTIFDAANLPSGIYIYRIVSGNFQASKKMILLK